MENRREFIKKTAAATAFSMVANWASALPTSDKFGNVLPKRQLTRDGQKVTSFCLGGLHLGATDNERDAQEMIERAMELGVRFFDNARVYNKGRSEEYVGKFLTPKYRDEVFLMSKAPAKTGEAVRRQLDESLKALKTDYLDLWQMHTLRSPEDVDKRIKDGVLDAFLEAKQQGKTKYIGFTGHRNPETHLYFLKRLSELGLEFDTCQMPLNVCDPSFQSFQHDLLPVLLEKEYGVIAMKTMAGGGMLGKRHDITPKDIKTEDIPNLIRQTKLTLANLHEYVYSLPVSALCSGCYTIKEMEANIKVLKRFKQLSVDDMERLVNYAKPHSGIILENYKRILA